MEDFLNRLVACETPRWTQMAYYFSNIVISYFYIPIKIFSANLCRFWKISVDKFINNCIIILLFSNILNRKFEGDPSSDA